MLGGCGRLDFTSEMSLNEGRGAPCGPSFTAPDPLTITGTTYDYADFQNDRNLVPHTVVTALSTSGTVLATTTSDASSNYTLSVPSGGIARQLVLTFHPPGYFTTTEILDGPVDRSTTGQYQIVWTAGDGPVWSEGAMGSVYGTTTETVDSSKSTLSVTTSDCSGAALEGVAVTVDPAPDVLAYIGMNGYPMPGATATAGPFANVVGFNAQPGTTHITASKDGYAFEDQTVEIAAGDHMTLIEMRPIE